jgi:hypothetical protein
MPHIENQDDGLGEVSYTSHRVGLYRILYQINKNKFKTYHHYLAKDAVDAINIEHRMTELKNVCNLRIMSVEKWDRFQKKWVNESDSASREIDSHNSEFRIAKETAWAKDENIKE